MVTADTDVCADRVLCALGALESMKVDANDTALRQAMAARFASRFASRFDARDRLYNAGRPQWHQFVNEAVKRLVDEKAPSRRNPKATANDAETRDPPQHPQIDVSGATIKARTARSERSRVSVRESYGQ